MGKESNLSTRWLALLAFAAALLFAFMVGGAVYAAEGTPEITVESKKPSGQNFAQKVKTTIKIGNYNAEYTYKYSLYCETDKDKDWEAEKELTGIAADGTVTLDDLKYGYRIRVAAYKDGKQVGDYGYFKVLNDKLLNGDFQAYQDTNGGTIVDKGTGYNKGAQYAFNNVYGWKTTASNKYIEIGYESHYLEKLATAVRDGDTNYIAELNAQEPSSLYQEITTETNSLLSWSVKHAAKRRDATVGGADVMAVVVGPALDASESYKKANDETNDIFQNIVEAVAKADTAAAGDIKKLEVGKAYEYTDTMGGYWKVTVISSTVNEGNDPLSDPYSGDYLVPANQGETVLGFTAISASTSNTAYGNVIDDVTFGKKTTNLPKITKESVAEPTDAGTINEKMTATVKIENYSADYTYKYAINDESTQNKDWQDAQAITLDTSDAKNVTGTIPGLRYGDHVKVATYTKDGKTEIKGTDSYFKVLTDELLNGGFEVVSGSDYIRKSGATVYAWRTTANDKKIEVNSNTYRSYGLGANEGSYLAEINAVETASLYQEIDTTNGDLSWSFAHAARTVGNGTTAGSDTMAVVIGPAIEDASNNYKKKTTTEEDIFTQIVKSCAADGDITKLAKDTEYTGTYGGKSYFVKVISDSKDSQWHNYNGTYKVPSGQSETVFAFTAISTAGGQRGSGNLLDAISFAIKKTTVTPPTGTNSTYDGKKHYSGVAKEDPDGLWTKTLDQGAIAADDWYTATVTLNDTKRYEWPEGDENIDKADASRYLVHYKIEPKEIEVKVTVKDKLYDGNTNAEITEIELDEDAIVTKDGADAKDDVSLDVEAITAAFADATAGADKEVTASGAKLTGADAKNYKIKYVVNKPSITEKKAPKVTAPTAKELTYDGTEQKLINAGKTIGGTMQYKLGEDGEWSTAIPAAKEAGTYKVYYKVVGNDLYEDDPGSSLEVTIKKKAVTAETAAETKTYDGKTDATVTAEVPETDIAEGDSIVISGVKGTFEDADAGTGKKVTVDATKASVTGEGSANYAITYPDTTGTINQADAKEEAKVEPKTLTYNGEPQELVTPANKPEAGIEYYDEATGKWTDEIPTETKAGTYTVKYRTKADKNHKEGTTQEVEVTIAKAKVAVPAAASKVYTGETQTADAKDADNYKVSEDKGGKNVGTYPVVYTLTDADNYEWETKEGTTVSEDGKSVTVPFEITKAEASVTEPEAAAPTYTGEPQKLLKTPAATDGGTVQYSLDGVNWTDKIPEATDAGTYTVYTKVVGDPNHTDKTLEPITVTIAKAKVAVPTVSSKVYNGENQKADVNATDRYHLSENEGGKDVGTYPVVYTLKDAKNYEWETKEGATVSEDGTKVTVPFEITKAEPSVTEPKAAAPTYTGEPQKLLETPAATDGGNVKYSLDGVNWTEKIPEATDAGTYKVYTKIEGDANYTDKTLEPITVTIAKQDVKTPADSSKTYTGEPQTADVEDTDNYTVTTNEPQTNVGTYDVVLTLKDAKNYKWEDGAAVSGDDSEKATVKFAITKKPAAKATAPTANNRTADGSTKPLLATPATTTEGEIEYSIDGGKTWTKGIPTASKAGTYTVCYRVAGDENHEAGPVQSVTVKIAEPNYSYLLNKNVSATEKNGKLKVTWHKVPGAEGYKVYVQYCGKDFSKKSINQVKSGKATKITVTKVNGKKRNLKKNIKLYVVAYKTVNGKEKTIAKSIIMHFVGSKNKAYTNPKKITLAKSAFTLKVGKAAKIKGKVTLANPKKKGLGNDHARVLRFRSGNKKVATVSKSGKITAKGKGSCVIYVYARNGLTKEVKVTVK